jgi:hypothetical protein
MPAAIQSQVGPAFLPHPGSAAGHDQLTFASRDLLRRHSGLHEASHTRVAISCDACRANKTKCSGGTQCLLCARRGINCTFRSSFRQPKGASTSDGSAAVNASISEDNRNDDDESTPPGSSGPENFLTENALSTDGEPLPPTLEFFGNLTIVPSNPAPGSEFQPLAPGIEAIYGLLVAEKSSLEGVIQEFDELQEWLTKYRMAYFRSFHLRWPILHAPTFDIRTVSLPLAASVCVIGAWFQSCEKWTERFYALRVHDILVQRLLQSMVRILCSSPRDSPLISHRLSRNR